MPDLSGLRRLKGRLEGDIKTLSADLMRTERNSPKAEAIMRDLAVKREALKTVNETISRAEAEAAKRRRDGH